MQHATAHHPPTMGTTRGNGAAVALLVILAAVLTLAAVVSIAPAPLGGVAVLALALGVAGVALTAGVER